MKLNHDDPLSDVAFKFNLRRYSVSPQLLLDDISALVMDEWSTPEAGFGFRG